MNDRRRVAGAGCIGLLAFLFHLTGAAAPAAAAPIRLSFVRVGQAGAPVCKSAVVTLTPQAAKAGEPAPAKIEATVEVPGQREVELAAGRTWRLEVRAQGCWSRELLVAAKPTPAAEPVLVRLFPTGTLRARLTPPRGEPLPKELGVRFQPTPSGSGRKDAAALPESTLTCPVREGLWECPVPAGVLDLRLKGEALVPVYRWGIELAAGTSRDLGEVRLSRGASVSGFVEMAERGAPTAGCRIALAPLAAGTPNDPIAYDRRAATALAAETDGRGFFQLEGVPPGAYRVTATKEGFATAQRSPIVVRRDLESQIVDALLLARPVALEIDVSPPLDPYGRPWKLALSAPDPADEHHFEPIFTVTPSAEGHLARKGIAAGSYRLDVMDEQGSRWLSQEVRIGVDGATLSLTLPVVEVRGRVTLGGDPLAATIWLGHRKTERVRFDSDEKGRFEGFLPKAGTWSVELASERERLRLSLDPVEVEPPRGKRFAEVDIRVPDTTLEGKVVDESGQAVGGADLSTASLANSKKEQAKGWCFFRADADGRFKVRGLPVGQTSIQARAGEQSSDWENVALDEGRKAPDLELVVRRSRTLTGHVFSEGAPVPGARVVGWPDFATGVTLFAEDVTGPDGTFKLALPASARSANLAVFPPGFALRLLRVGGGADPIEVQVDAGGGTLVLDGGGKEDGRKSLNGLLVHNGVAMPLDLLGAWIRLQRAAPPSGGRLAVPNVESGEYSVCRGTGSPALQCSSGALAPFGELALRVPSGSGG